MNDFTVNGDILDFVDATTAAAQIGRLDFVTSLLAIISLILVISGVVAFIHFRGVARKQAKEEASRIAAETAEIITRDYLRENAPKWIKQYSKSSEGWVEKDTDIIEGYPDNEEGESR